MAANCSCPSRTLFVSKFFRVSDVDKFAIQITQKNFPHTVQVYDVKNLFTNSTVTQLQDLRNKLDDYFFTDSYLGNLEKLHNDKNIDLLCGGSPCQDLSIAKKDRKGLEGNKSSLFWEYVRILNEVKPRYFLLENVASMTKENKDLISKTLDVEPILINSSLVTAQQRKRLYWSNIPNFGVPQDRGIFLKDILGSGQTYQEKSYALTATYDKAVFWNTLEKKQRSMILEPIGCAIRGRYNDNDKSEQRLELRNDNKANCITTVDKDSLVCESVIYSPYNQMLNRDGKAYSLGTNPHCQTAIAGQLVIEPIRLGHFNKGGQGDRIYSVEGKSVCLSANGGGRGAKTGLYKIDLPDGDYIVRKLTPTECERLQGFTDGYTECVSNSQRYKTLGNGFTVPVIEHILSHAFKRSPVAIKEEFYQKPLVRNYEKIAVNAHQNPDLFNQTNQLINV